MRRARFGHESAPGKDEYGVKPPSGGSVYLKGVGGYIVTFLYSLHVPVGIGPAALAGKDGKTGAFQNVTSRQGFSDKRGNSRAPGLPSLVNAAG
jgi:hypothetical protein